MPNTPVTDPTSLAVAYYLNGQNFRLSAEKLMDGLDLDEAGRPKTLMAIPLYFLASQAAELFLKAALLKRGFDASALKKYDYRHNLTALLEEIQEMKVPVTAATAALVTDFPSSTRCINSDTRSWWTTGKRRIGPRSLSSSPPWTSC